MQPDFFSEGLSLSPNSRAVMVAIAHVWADTAGYGAAI
jgi:hypothetical protein